HILYSQIDEKYPASLSKKIVTRLLRKTIGFNGLVITDDLEMKGITEGNTVPKAAVKAIQAGSDLLLICHSVEEQKGAIEALTHAVEKGTIREAQIDESLNRILRLKERFLLPRHRPKTKEIQQVIGCEEHRALVEECAAMEPRGVR
ncbi:MAG: glycoside hydrolase family 3 N-terminal domain-containing protein, partial [Candidatus Manganitrophaceae bacterium]